MSDELKTKRWQALRVKILERDEYTCYLCGGVASTVDHIKARSKGGDMWDEANLAACCQHHNSSKNNKDIDEVRIEWFEDSWFAGTTI